MKQPLSITDDERREALRKAAEVRQQRAVVRQQLKAGEITFGELLERSADDVVGKMKVLSVLEALPGVGKVMARRTLEQVGVAETRRVRGLGLRQRERLLELLAESDS